MHKLKQENRHGKQIMKTSFKASIPVTASQLSNTVKYCKKNTNFFIYFSAARREFIYSKYWEKKYAKYHQAFGDPEALGKVHFVIFQCRS